MLVRPLTGASSLPPLSGRLFVAYRIAWFAFFAVAIGAAGYALYAPESHPMILGLRLAKSIVLIAVSAILFRRRRTDPMAAMLGLSFLLWTTSSSFDFAGMDLVWPILIDRFRFLLFAFALLLFPDGHWFPRWTPAVAAAILLVFLIGIVEALGLSPTQAFLPFAIACVLLTLIALLSRYRSQSSITAKQQLKWVALGLVAGIALILMARAGAAVGAQMDMPMAGTILFEGLFQVGIVVIALGFLTSLLRYRLYDAETAISRSAAYAGLTLALVAIFAASESIIQAVGQRYFGPDIGDLSGGFAAAIAAVLLTPLHSRISNWAEMHFQSDLNGLKTELPELLATLSGSSSVAEIGSAILPPIGEAIHATRIALIVDGSPVSFSGLSKSEVLHWISRWRAPKFADLFDQDEDRDFPVRMALQCPFGKIRGWLLLGPRPDGSHYGKDDLDALAAIAPPLRQTLFSVAERQRERRATKASLDRLLGRISKLELALTGHGHR